MATTHVYYLLLGIFRRWGHQSTPFGKGALLGNKCSVNSRTTLHSSIHPHGLVLN
jgi:hypothetical protein